MFTHISLFVEGTGSVHQSLIIRPLINPIEGCVDVKICLHWLYFGFGFGTYNFRSVGSILIRQGLQPKNRNSFEVDCFAILTDQNSAYGRQQISWRIRIVGPKPFFLLLIQPTKKYYIYLLPPSTLPPQKRIKGVGTKALGVVADQRTPSPCNSTNTQNPPIQKSCCNF